jgi:ribosome biogenesis GTPase / thiamine phosphate phosphatase
MKALVYKSTGSWYVVKTEQGEIFNARAKGVLKIEGITSTNPIAVGDWVNIEPEQDADKTAMITAIEDRENYVARTSPHNKNQHHIVASNLDQSLLICTIKEPRTSQGFIDRFLVSCEAYHVPAILIFNKADIYKKKEMERYEEWKETYEGAGYAVVLASAPDNIGLEEIKTILHNKTTLLSGHSGVGKSTLVNRIFPHFTLRTAEVSGWSGKGLHTTTFAEMFELPEGGKIIDTPGVREFALSEINKGELSHYFPEMRRVLNDCQFNNCLHQNEPGCAVKAGVEEGTVSVDRYASYLTLLEGIEDKEW